MQRYIPWQDSARLAHDLTQTVQFSNKKQQDLDNAHAHWGACTHPVLWVLDSNGNHKVCHLSWIQWMKRAFNLKLQHYDDKGGFDSGCSWRQLFLYFTSFERQMPTQTPQSYLFSREKIQLSCTDTPCDVIQCLKLPRGYVSSSSFSASFSNMLCFLDKLIHAHTADP